METLAILPIKSFDHAKQRLEPGLGPGPRRALAEAMFSDVLVALGRSKSVESVLVVTSDRGAQLIAAGHGTMVLDDPDDGHSEAATRGIRQALDSGIERVVLVPGDCPTLDPGELDELLARPITIPSALIVPDRHGTGTNALALTPPTSLAPAFGPGSCQRHVTNARANGTNPEVIQVPSLALDIDTPDDLSALQETLAATRGGAAHTRGMLNQLWRSQH